MTIEVGIVGMVDVEKVIVEDRARQEMGNLEEFENNLKEIGLTTPLTMKANSDGTYRLLAGERRFTILKRNGVTEIPARIYEKELSDLEMKVIEKSENFHRKDMEYWELDKLTLEIHRMQQELHGVKSPGPGHDGWSVEDTSSLAGTSKFTVSTAIKRAEAREAFPEIFEKCKTASDASKVLKKLDEAVIKQTIAQKLETQNNNSTLTNLARNFILGDFFGGVRKIPDNSIHLVEIDPPYAINLAKQKKKDSESQYILEQYNEVDVSKYEEFLFQTFKQCYRVMSQHSWLICWFAPEPWFETVYNLLNAAGFGTTRICGIWTKGGSGQSMNPSIRLANTYEQFFYAWKGQPALNKAGRGNEFHFSPVPAAQKTHPTERPVELMIELYNTFAFAKSRVMIPFLGSGNGLIAAYQLGMSAFGYELGKGYKDSFLIKVNKLSQCEQIVI